MHATRALAQIDVAASGTGNHDTVGIFRTMDAVPTDGNIVTRSDTIHRRLMSQDDVDLHHSARLGVCAGILETRRDDSDIVILM
jgi:hypothetical protein